jgi:Na+/proline symporter
LDPGVAFSFGIVTSIGLIAGSISDQQYWQRSFAAKREHLKLAFVVGGILFGIVPIALSVLGFIAANPDMGIALPEGTGLPMIGVATVVKLLPLWAAVLFVVILLSGLESTLDSALCAASSLYAIDMAPLNKTERELLRKERLELPLSGEDRRAKERLDVLAVKRARIAMYGISILGLVTALIVQHLFPLDRLWWIFNGVASCFAVPTVLSVYWDRLSATGAFWGIVASLIGLVPFVYGNWVQNDVITVLSAVGIIAVNLACCLVFRHAPPWREGGPSVARSGSV